MKSSGELLEPAHAHPANRRGLLAQRVCAPRSRKTTFGADRQTGRGGGGGGGETVKVRQTASVKLLQGELCL